MKPLLLTCLTWVLTVLATAEELWSHIETAADFNDLRGMSAQFDNGELALKIDDLYMAPGDSGTNPAKGIGWVSIPPPTNGWDLESIKHIQAAVKNNGDKPALTTLWVVSYDGWSAVGSDANLGPGESTTLSVYLRQTYPDKTPKIDPTKIKEIRIMVQRTDSASLTVSKLKASGTAENWVAPTNHLNVPGMISGKPAPGKRVHYQLPSDTDTKIYCTLYLPPSWKPGSKFPVIAEYPGNIFYRAKSCWSTGRPEQCDMGYGISEGRDVIWVSLPFIDIDKGEIVEAGFGSNLGADTTNYAVKVIDDICENWGGDRGNLYLCGFSRGSIACGYIGLSNDKIASLWKGLIGCQHYDGSRWRQSRMKDAVIRAPRFKGKAVFQIDNSKEKYQPVVDATDPSVEWTWTNSKLGYHATAMFLDDRPSTIQLRKWFRELITE